MHANVRTYCYACWFYYAYHCLSHIFYFMWLAIELLNASSLLYFKTDVHCFYWCFVHMTQSDMISMKTCIFSSCPVAKTLFLSLLLIRESPNITMEGVREQEIPTPHFSQISTFEKLIFSVLSDIGQTHDINIMHPRYRRCVILISWVCPMSDRTWKCKTNHEIVGMLRRCTDMKSVCFGNRQQWFQ